MKNVFKVLVITIILLIVQAEEVQAAEIVRSGMCGGNVSWTIDSEGTLVISGEGKMYDYSNFYSDRKSPFCSSGIKKIIIEEGVTSIGDSIFQYCRSLTEVSIPSGVTSIGALAFGDCKSLTEVNIPSGVTSIGTGAFGYCSSLTEINIPLGVTNIDAQAFYWCGLTEVNIPSSVTNIEYQAFAYCESLTKIDIPLGVTIIGEDAFRGCSSLVEITIPSSVTRIEGDAFYECSSLQQINIPESVTSIGDYAFYECSSLTEITIPSSVTNIGSSTFKYCSSLTKVAIPSSVTNIGSSAFEYCDSLMKIAIPSSVTNIGSSAFGYCSSLTEITIPSGVTNIGSSAFRYCSSLMKIVIPSSVTNIGSGAFEYCSSLKDITIPESVTNIDFYTFCKCSSLKEINIHEGVISIDKKAFLYIEDKVIINCRAGSYAEIYAKESGIQYKLVSGNMSAASDKSAITVDAAKTNNTVSSNPNHILSEARYGVLNTNLVKEYKTITLSRVLGLVKSKEIAINCTVIGDADTVKEYVFYKGTKKLASSCTGAITVTLDDNCIGNDYYVEVVSTKGERTKTALQFNVKSAEELNEAEMQMGGSSLFSVTFPEDIPFLGGQKLELDVFSLPVYVVRNDDNTVRVGVNLKKDMFDKDSEFFDGATIEEFSKEWGKLVRQTKAVGEFLNEDVKKLEKYVQTPRHKSSLCGQKLNVIVSGYGEGKFDEAGNVIATIDFVIAIEYKNNKIGMQTNFLGIPITAELEIEADAGLESEMTLEWTTEGIEYKGGDIALDLSFEMSVFGGVGIRFLAAVGAFGSGELSGEIVWLSTERDPGLDKLDLTLEAGLKGYVGPLKGEIVLVKKTWNLYSRPEVQTFSLRTISDVVDEQLTYASMYSASIYQLAEDNYSTTFTDEEGTVGNIISDAFISAQPVVAAVDDYVVMTYLTMDSSRPAVDSTVLMYTVYDKAQGIWSEPQKVDDNDTMDWTASLYSNGESIRLVYVEQDSVLSEGIGINDLTTGMRITTAVFDAESMGFINFEDVAKSNETVYVSRPVVSEVENVPVICWVQGPSGDYFGTNNKNSIYYSSLTDEGWSDSIMLEENLNCVTELAAGSFEQTLTVACVTDGDNDLDTTDDRVVTLIESGASSEIVAGDVGNIMFDVLPGQTEVALLWYEGGNIGIRTKDTVENEYLFTADEEGVLNNSVGADFGIVGDKLLFSKTEQSGDSSIYSISYDEGFTMPIPVVSASGSITTFSADGEMAVWVDTEATVLEDSIDDYSVIGYCMYNEQYDVAALYTEFEHEVLEPGKEISVTIEVQNNTDAELTSVAVLVLDANEDIFFETTAECSIASGTLGEVIIAFNAPLSFVGAEYKVLVTGQKTDTVPENNYAELSFSPTELSVSARETIYEEKGYFVVDVVNESYVATGGTVTLGDKDGNVLHTEVIDNIAGKGTCSIVIDAEELLQEADKKVVIVRVEADKEEYDTLNNTVTENVVVLSGEIPYVTVVFMGGEEELSNTVYPVGSTIVPEELPDGMTGWYELGDESKTVVTEFDDISTDKIYVAMVDEEEKFNSISIRHNCSFDNNFTLVYAIKQSDLEGFDNIRLLVEKDEYEGDTLTETSTKGLEWTTHTIGSDDYYRFDYSNIKSCEIGDEVRAVLVAEKDGVEYRRTADVYNLKDYAYNRLLASDVGEFKTLLVDMLNYCAASQEYFDYRENSLVNSALTEEQRALSSGSYATLNNNESTIKLEGKTVPKIMKNVSFGNRIEAVFAMDLSNYDDISGITLHVEYTNMYGEEKVLDIGSGRFTYDSGIGMYYGKVSSLDAAELRNVMTVTVMHNGVPVSDTITYSIETYVSKKLASSTDDVFKALLEDMMIYADSARAYFE